MGIELLVMNGEDYYGANGEILYLEQNEGQLNNIKLFINMDALGYIKGKTTFSFYNLMEETGSKLRQVLDQHPGALEGEPWYQGDHSIVVMKGVPAVAVTSEHFVEITRKYTHTRRDVFALVDTGKLVEAALTIRNMILALSRTEV
jgi:aminopeptidase YwaD